MDPLQALERRLRAAAPAALRAGAEAIAADARAHAGGLASGVVVGPVVASGDRAEVAIEAGPVEGEMPPAVREFGSARTGPRPFMRPVAERAPELAGPEIARGLAKP